MFVGIQLYIYILSVILHDRLFKHIGSCTVCKKDIIINYMLIITLIRLGGLVIEAKILAPVGFPGHT